MERPQTKLKPTARSVFAKALIPAVLVLSAPAIVWAQSFDWPWEEQNNDPPPRPQPEWRSPDEQRPPAQYVPRPGPQGGQWGAAQNPICVQLEQRLVQEGQRGNNSRSALPQIESEIRSVSQSLRETEDKLENGCYEYFLFSKSLRGTRRCRSLASQADGDRRRLSELQTRRADIMGSSGRSYQDDIINELARNNCGDTYVQQARRRARSNNPFSFWSDDSEGRLEGGLGQYGNLGYATYRTLCVRLCDGYYFPVSFSTLPNHFQRDQQNCQSRCAAPVELYYYQNPGGAVEQMVSVQTNQPYTQLKSAFRYRKDYIKGCSCKQAEYVPQSKPGQPGAPPVPQPEPALRQGNLAPPPGGAGGAQSQPPAAAQAPHQKLSQSSAAQQ